MSTFSYKAITRDGKRQEGTVEAEDRRLALAKVAQLGYTPLSVKEAQTVAALPKKRESLFKLAKTPAKKMKPREVLLFSSELSDLIEAGMTLGAALNSLAKQGEETSGMSVVCADLRDRIMRGEAFSDAVNAHPDSFPPIYGNMIRAGEASGAMVEILHRLVEHYERYQGMKSKITAALTYPAIVLVFGVIAVIFAMVKIVPQFMQVFSSMGAELPLSTQMMIAMSNFLRSYGIFAALAAVFAFSSFKRYINGKGRLWWDGLKLKMPLIKGIIASGAYAGLAFTLQTLLGNGVNVLNALKIAEETTGNAVIGRELKIARERVTDGTTISGPLAASGIFPRLMTDMLALGEQTGDMPGALGHIGKRYEADLDRNIKIFSTALEPLLIIGVSLMVGFVAVSILSAVFKATATMGGG